MRPSELWETNFLISCMGPIQKGLSVITNYTINTMNTMKDIDFMSSINEMK